MNKGEVIKTLKEIIVNSMELKKDPSEIVGIDMILELGINSVDALEILVWIENTFDMQIPDEDLNADLLRSIENLADYIVRKKESTCV
jgi:acyl carrier protein